MFTDADRVWVLLGKRKAGEATESELSELASLLQSFTISTEMVDSLWRTKMDPVKDHTRSDLSWNRIRKRINAEGEAPLVRFAGYRKWVAAAVILLICGAGTLFFIKEKHSVISIPPDSNKNNQFITGAGSKSKLELPDGTKVWLNGNSKLVYGHSTFGVRLREVYLSGEAFFDVAKNEKVPFKVHTGEVTITVMGTAFNVKAYPGAETIETALVRGLIEVTTNHDPDRRIILKPDEKIVIPVQEKITSKNNSLQPAYPSVYSITTLHKNKANVIPETVWLQNRLEFDNESFSELAPKMEAWFNISITITNEEVSSKRFSGVIEKETLKETLKAMQLSYPFSYTIRGNELIIFKKNHSSP